MLPKFARTVFFQFEKNSNNKRVFINVRYPNKLPRDLVTINDIATIKDFKRSLVKNIYLDELSTASRQSSTGRLK
jgi:hypothetical protein